MPTITWTDESYAELGHRLWRLAGLTNADINDIVRGGVWNGAHAVAGSLKALDYRVVDQDGRDLSMTSLIHIWLQS